MPAGHILAVLFLASGAGAVEVNKPAPSCHADGSCVGDDGMLFQLGRRVSAKGEETLHTSGMVSKLEDLANKVIDGTEKITPATREALETIDDEMDSVISNAEQNQKDFQGSVDITKQSIETCGTDATTAHTNDGGINNLAAAVSNARTAHNTCRSSEATLKQDDNTKCKDFDDYVRDLKMPSCSCSTGQSLGIVGFKNCVAEMTSWSSTANTTWADKETLCKDAKSTHAAERTSCNTKQGSLESDFCAYNTALRMTCSAQDSCRATQKALRETAHASIAVSESAFKAEYESAKHVKCILKVLNATDEVKREMLTACTSKTVDTDHLNITYHEVPDPAPCDLTPVAKKPCDQEWTDEEFQGKTWLTDAPLNSCVSCPAVGGATATPNSQEAGSEHKFSGCAKLVDVAGNQVASTSYWLTKCKDIPSTASYVKVTMGSVVDYFKPTQGYDLCAMLTSHSKHVWSNDGHTWITIPFYDGHLGGCQHQWPKTNVAGDSRAYVSFWGTQKTSQGGCCHDSLNDVATWGRAFTMSFCSV